MPGVVWIALLTSLLIMLFALTMERIEAALPPQGSQPTDPASSPDQGGS
jgi:hypothetical protein